MVGYTANAFEGTYPASGGFTAFNEGRIITDKGCYTPTDEDYMFTVGGKKFILLDTDSDGNFFVMTEEHYGQHAYETALGSHMPIQTATKSGSGYTFSDVTSPDNNSWIFNPENKSSIAYWLNNEFYTNGNGAAYRLPEEIKGYILDREWQIEGFKTYCATATRLFDRYFDSLGITGYVPAETIASGIGRKPYTVNGKLALMSLSEYMAYKDIIGVSFSHGGWGGMMLRSQDAFLTAVDVDSNNRQMQYYFGPLQVLASSTDTSVKLSVNIADAPYGAYYYVRPVFWLSKDFFAKVKCDISTLGKYPKQFIADNSYETLSKIYDANEISNIGIVKAEGDAGKIFPKVTDVGFFGDAILGKRLRGSYAYNSNTEEETAGTKEYLTSYQWYVSDSIKGKKELVSNGNGLDYIPSEEYAGKFIWLAVTPKNAYNNRGETVFSQRHVKIKKDMGVGVEFADNDGNAVTSIPADSKISIKINFNLTDSKTAVTYISGYDTDKAIKYLSETELSGKGTKDISIEIPDCTSCKVIVVGAEDEAPYCINEIKR